MNRQTTLRRAVLGCIVAIAVATSAGCAEIESVTAEPYEPAALESTGPDKPARITLTDEAVDRVALQTTEVKTLGKDLTVDHAALVFDKAGKPWVFTVVGPRTYVRAAIGIKETQDGVVIMSSGPPVGTQVVTVGAIELWGAELGIAGKH
ncbi:MAG TPA: hypothetical protein VIZ70_00145 [Propionibacteriaceae bacterium]|jgi:hypothetical protein